MHPPVLLRHVVCNAKSIGANRRASWQHEMQRAGAWEWAPAVPPANFAPACQCSVIVGWGVYMCVPSVPRPILRHNSVLRRQTCDKMVRYCENTTPVLKIYSAECFGSFRAAAIATRSKPCTHGPSRPPACIIMLELRAASLWTDALLRHSQGAPPKTASSSQALRPMRAWTERPESTRDLDIVAFSSR